MRRILTSLIALFAVVAFTGAAYAEGGCGSFGTASDDPLITADGSTAGPVTPAPPKTEPEG